jgi:subtilase family serine protease
MKKLLQIFVISILTIGCQTDNQSKKQDEKPDFKTALIELLKEYPEARLNNENDVGKLGFCVEAHPGGIITANYTYDKINGRLEVYNRTTGEIQYIDSIVNGKSVGPIKAYNENGNLAYTIKNIAPSDTIINSEFYKNYRPSNRGYLIIFDDQGQIIEEGTAYYDESIEVDFVKGKDWKTKNK